MLCKKRAFSIEYLIMGLVCLSITASAQFLVIHQSSGTTTKIALDDISKLTFDLPTVSAKDQPLVLGKLKMSVANLFPNPFSPRVEYSLTSSSVVTMRIMDIQGRTIRVIQCGTRQPGNHSVSWDLRNDSGKRVTTGPYLLSIQGSKEKIANYLYIVQ